MNRGNLLFYITIFLLVLRNLEKARWVQEPCVEQS